ncbi:MAG: biotin--[acetyl-CoA-carboxylase] ligase, partial [Sphingomonadaceae bacterium]|nr:biotin--[acetyl-CoA-carboxylase] ligase [Sphingomonadaceae bacterium]
GDAVVVGVGANLARHPDLPDRHATSLAALGIATPEPIAVAEALTEIFARWLARWRTDGLPAIRAAWLARAHPLGTALSATLPDGSRVEGLFDGLTEDCALRLRLADGALRVIHAGDVFLI